MKYLKKYKLFEGEITKIAAAFADPDREFGFTSPNDPIVLKYCNVEFPDGSIITFDVESENYLSDIDTIKIKVSDRYKYDSSGNIAKLYKDLYGKNLQFDFFREYRLVRMYMTRLDLFDTKFDGYIYDENKLGFIEVSIHFGSENDSDRVPSYIRKSGICGPYEAGYFVLSEALKIVNKDKSWKNYYIDRKDEVLHRFLEYLDPISMDTNDEVVPINVNYEWMNVCGYIYLYDVLYGFKKEDMNDVKYVLSRYNHKMNPEKIIGILHKMV